MLFVNESSIDLTTDIGKYNYTGTGLESALDLDVDLLANHVRGLIYDDHGAVVEVADALPFILSFTSNAKLENFAREENCFERIGHGGQIDEGDFLKLRDFAEIKIGGEKLCTGAF